MDFQEVVRSRRSIRRYQHREVPEGVVRELCAAATLAPSSLNGQPWYFIAVREERTKRALAELKNRHCPVEKQMYAADFLAEAPVILVVCVERARAHDRGLESAVLATGHILLAAARQGLGSVYLSAYKSDNPEVAADIRGLLGIPPEVDPVTLVPLGYPAEVPTGKTVRSLDEVVFHERFGQR